MKIQVKGNIKRLKTNTFYHATVKRGENSMVVDFEYNPNMDQYFPKGTVLNGEKCDSALRKPLDVLGIDDTIQDFMRKVARFLEKKEKAHEQ